MKKNTEQCFLTGMKSTCQISVTFEHIDNRRKTGRTFLPRALKLFLQVNCNVIWKFHGSNTTKLDQELVYWKVLYSSYKDANMASVIVL